MNYERIILEMLDRIKALEDRLDKIEVTNQTSEVIDQSVNMEDFEMNDVSIIQDSGRKRSRQEVITIFRNKMGFSVRTANRSEGSGIVITRNSKSYNVRISFSRSYDDLVKADFVCSGWHTVFLKDLENPKFMFYIFVVEDASGIFHYFIYKREDLISNFANKAPDANNKLHFYFRIKTNGRPVEFREEELDVSKNYNNWDIFSNL